MVYLFQAIELALKSVVFVFADVENILNLGYCLIIYAVL